MLHPHTEMRFISEAIGGGVFATRDIPAGAIVFVRDNFDKVFTPAQFAALEGEYREIANLYSYRAADGHRVMGWDLSKYVNHSCAANVIATGYGFELAIRDIRAGDQITDDYGLFNVCEELQCGCGEASCRGRIAADDIHRLAPLWDEQLQALLPRVREVVQPLWAMVGDATRQQLDAYLDGRQPYRSVLTLAMPAAEI